MVLTTAEQALRSAMHDITAGQPEAPADRVGAVRRRHVRRRQIQGVAAAAAVAVVAAGVTVLAGGTGGGTKAEPLHRPMPAWALPWLDHRDGSVAQRVLDGALHAWVSSAPDGSPRSADRVIWYVGQRAGGSGAVVVAFEVDGVMGRRLVAGWADAGDVVHGQKPFTRFKGGWSTPWILHDVAAPQPGMTTMFGLHARGVTTGDDWVVLAARPSVGSVIWQAAGTPGGTVGLRGGLAVFDAGQVQGEVLVRTPPDPDRVGAVAAPAPIGLAGDDSSAVPYLAEVPALQGVPSVPAPDDLGEMAAQGDDSMSNTAAAGGGRVMIYLRCRGDGVIHVTVDDGPFAATRPCDGRQYDVRGPTVRPSPQRNAGGDVAGGHGIQVQASDLASYRVRAVIIAGNRG